MSQEENEHNEVDGMKEGVDSTGEVMHRLPGLLCMILSSRLSLSETQTYRNVCLLHRICPAPLTDVPLLPNLAALNLALMKAFITCRYDARRSPEVDALLR